MKLSAFIILTASTLLFSCSNESNINVEQKMQPIKAQDLQKQWQLVSIDNEAIKTTSSLNIDDQTKANGNLACNNFFGVATLENNKLRIDKMGSTRKMCEPSVNKIEMTVSSTLSTWSEITISEQKLILTGEKHKLVYSIK